MSEIYNVYETSFKTLTKNIDSILNKDEFNSKTIQKLKNDIQEINRLIKQMKLEIDNLKLSNNKIPKEIEDNLKKYKYIVDEYNNQLVLIQNKYCINNDNKKNILIDDEDNREIGLIEDDYVQQTKINNIQKDIYDIEQIGYNIGNSLDNQNEQLKYMNNNVKMMNEEADMTNDMVNKLIYQAKRNKIIFYVLLIILVIIFLILMIIKKNKNGNKNLF